MARRSSVSSVSSEKRLGKPFQYDPDFKGPRDRRSCTDILCLLLFVVFLVCWGLLGFIAVRDGDPSRILQPTDSSGQQCGVSPAVSNKPYLLFFDPSLCARPTANVLVNGCASPSACVASCPKEEFYAPNYYKQAALSGPPPICLFQQSSPTTGAELRKLVESNKCAKWYKKTIAVGKFCVPDVMGLGPNQPLVVDGQAIGSSVEDVTKGGNIMMALQRAYEAGEKVVSDIVQSYSFIILGLAVAMVLSFFYILLLRWVTGVMVWSSILLVLVLLGVGLYACYAFWAQLKDGSTVALWGDVPAEFRGILDDPTTWMAFMIVLAIILGVLLLMVLFLRKRISLAVTLIEQGGKAVSSMTSTLFFPVVPWALQVAVVAYTATVVLYLATSGVAIYKTHGLNDTSCTCVAVNINRDGVDCIPSNFNHECSNCIAQGASCQFFRYNPPDYTKWLHVFNIFGAIWTLFFISGMAQMILAATFATWYWTFHKSDVPFFVLTRSFFMSITYHTGTVAFGSLIISIVRFIRLILDYIEKQAKQYSDNSVAKCVMCCCKCCFACVEGFLKFISRNAYIMCAVHGKNFCASAKDAFNLLMRNVIRVVVIDKITDFVFFMGKLLITAVVCTAVYFSLRQWPPDPKLNYNAVPVTVTGVGSFLIASVFFGVYSVAVDTLFLCFLEDCERNDGTAAKPYYMSPSLMRIFGKKNRRD
ncbi:choline transporter-like 2 [Frankliniella occidentalis]|uniref:Choline transporter-like protein n=1 Tax=Frankliniella occidentalis TaxID=133901 RepID=A0A9C6TZM6_FRAOC|nr:choline transporter-like 2 [Frankliniella occidentalis]